MKKFFYSFIIICISLVCLCGCNNSNNENSSFNAKRISSKTSIPKKEVEISKFSTNILDQTPNRVDNINLTCNKINNIIIKNGETFSFCNTVGEVSSNTGYKEADVLDAKGKPFKRFWWWKLPG